MAHINHIGLYVQDLELEKQFFEKYFGASSGEMYHNPLKGFFSYMLSFGNGAQLEIMHRESFSGHHQNDKFGYAHIAFSVGSKNNVDSITSKLKNDGFEVLDGPRTTGDGFYESSIADHEGNLIEITV